MFKLTFLDVETTGLSAERDRICEIAILGFSGDRRLLSRYVRLVRPGGPIPEKVARIHGIAPVLVETAHPFSEIAEEVLEELDGVILGYNVGFDLGFLRSELERCGRQMPDLPVVDVLEMVRTHLPGLRSYRLSAVARRIGLEIRGIHWAEQDVLLTAGVFFWIVNQLLGRDVEDWLEERGLM